MNYRPIISFRELKKSERELMKNAEAILKELGFKFKASSPFQDDREWELQFSDDYAKEMYIQFRDDADEDHSPVVIIDDILTDTITTVNGDSGYFVEEEIDEEDFEKFKEEYEEEVKDLFNTNREEKIENLDEFLSDIFSQADGTLEKNILMDEIKKLKTEKPNEKKFLEIIHNLLSYIGDEDLMELTYSIIE
jgi:hypothetical protein